MENSDELLNQLKYSWNLCICPSNAMLGGYLANFVMFCVQRKEKPLNNFLLFDMWGTEAIEVCLESVEWKQRNDSSTKAIETKMAKTDISKVELLDDSDDDENEDDQEQDFDVANLPKPVKSKTKSTDDVDTSMNKDKDKNKNKNKTKEKAPVSSTSKDDSDDDIILID